jgi:hypothetical protein
MNKESRKRLEELHLQQNREKYPNLPEHARPGLKIKDNNSNGLTKCIVTFLQLSGWQAERITNTGRYIDNSKTVTDVVGFNRKIGKGKVIASNMTKGTADVSATIYGRSVKIEVKYGKDRQSEAQKIYQASVEKAGGVYIIAKTFDGFLEWYDNFLKSIKS